MQHKIITTNYELAEFCTQASKVEAIAVDTEFVRTRTLYPQLGLIQLFDGNQLVLVDPLCVTDFSSLTALLTNPAIVKILHSCSEDLETFWHAFKIMPTPIFDSQFAASLVGKGTALGYAKLVELMLDIKVDKGESRTDWLARPLSEKQCEYAAKDVLYLFQIYPELKAEVESKNKLAWVYTEIEHLAQKKQVTVSLDSIYMGMKNSWKLTGVSLLALQKLAAWRTDTARKRDMALNFVVREENLFSIALKLPSSKNELRVIPGINPHEVRIHGDALIAIIADCKRASPAEYPPQVQRLNQVPDYKNTVSLIKKICLDVAQQNHIPVELLGSKKQVSQLLKWCWFEWANGTEKAMLPDLICNWRRSLLLNDLCEIESLQLANRNTEEQK